MICTPLKFLKMCKRVEFPFDKLEYLVLDESDKYFEFGLLR